MLANYIAAAMRNLARNRLHTAITTLSLAVGFAAVILASVFWRYEHNYDRFWPNAERIYLVTDRVKTDRFLMASDAATVEVATLAAANAPETAVVMRASVDELDLERGQIKGPEEKVLWADPGLFKVLQPRALEGELAGSLDAPGSMVVTKTLAEKYFGDGSPIGKTLTARQDGPTAQPFQLHVTAVVEDLPGDTHLVGGAFVSSATAGGFGAPPTAEGASRPDVGDRALTYLLAKQGVSREAIQTRLDGLAARFLSVENKVELQAVPLTEVYMRPADRAMMANLIVGIRTSMGLAVSLTLMIASLILLVGAINFITLMTARGANRAVEVGVRKASGARRGHLVLQFVGEAVIYAIFAFVVALALAEVLGPLFKALTASRQELRYPEDVPFLGILFAGAVGVGLLAGLYPALVLSSFRPASVLKGGPTKSPGSARLRQGLVALQFIPLVVLGLVALSTALDANRNVRMSLDIMPDDPLLIEVACTPALKAELAALPQVIETACMNVEAWRRNPKIAAVMIGRPGFGKVVTTSGKTIDLEPANVSVAGFAFHHRKLLAGRLPRQEDESTSGAAVVLDESTMRDLGFASPAAAVGRQVTWQPTPKAAMKTSTVMGVVADRTPVGDVMDNFFIPTPLPPTGSVGVGVRLHPGVDRVETLAAIDGVLSRVSGGRMLDRFFYSERITDSFADDLRAVRLLMICIAVGVVIAAFGLFGLAAFLAQQRTKEVGVRKAMGASRSRVVRLMLFQFALPVVVASVIACPVAVAVVTIIYRQSPSDMPALMKPEIIGPVIAAAILVALISTFLHAWRAASARPVTALRYE